MQRRRDSNPSLSCIDTKAAAEGFYISDWFKKAKAFAEGRAESWFILSAKYGLVSPNEVIEPYEQPLNSMPKKERMRWAEQVLKSILSTTNLGDHIVFLAGARYREFLIKELSQIGYTVEVPLAQMGIGEQLSWLKKNNRLQH